MDKLQPYRTWSRQQLWEAAERVINHYDPDHTEAYVQLRSECKHACMSIAWHPMTDYNGCTAVQDPHHPMPSCIVHDFNCIVSGWSKEHDKKFEQNNLLLGMEPKKAKRWYHGVRLGWNLFYFWKKKKEGEI